MRVQGNIRTKIEAGLTPAVLEIVDESHMHAGHAGARPEGESHFRVLVVADAFEGLSRVDRQRKVYELLADDLKSDIHALALTTRTPAEHARIG